MKSAKAFEYYYSNQMGRMLLLSGEEILGRSGMVAILKSMPAGLNYLESYPPANSRLGFPFEVVSELYPAMVSSYGPRGGQGLLMRIGRACFQHGLREFGPNFGLTDLAFRLLPNKTKLTVGAKAFADIFNKQSDQRVRIEDDEKNLYWIIERCPVCWGRTSDGPSCDLAAGLLQESLYWVSGGKVFSIEETHCHAAGDAECVFLINKTPLV
jgi:predicted hydrocarbon binding protein